MANNNDLCPPCDSLWTMLLFTNDPGSFHCSQYRRRLRRNEDNKPIRCLECLEFENKLLTAGNDLQQQGYGFDK